MTSISLNFASKPTFTYSKARCPFPRFILPSLRRMMREAFADAFSAISGTHDAPTNTFTFSLPTLSICYGGLLLRMKCSRSFSLCKIAFVGSVDVETEI
jgi:hypothetical protein